MGTWLVPEPWHYIMLALPGHTLQPWSPLGSVFEQTHVTNSEMACENLLNPLWPHTDAEGTGQVRVDEPAQTRPHSSAEYHEFVTANTKEPLPSPSSSL